MIRKPTIAEQRYTVGVNQDYSVKVTDDADTLAPDVRATFIIVLPAGHTALRRWAELMQALGHVVCIDTINLFADYSKQS